MNKYKIINILNEFFGQRTHIYKSELEDIDSLYNLMSENYGIQTTKDEIKECVNIFINALSYSE